MDQDESAYPWLASTVKEGSTPEDSSRLPSFVPYKCMVAGRLPFLHNYAITAEAIEEEFQWVKRSKTS